MDSNYPFSGAGISADEYRAIGRGMDLQWDTPDKIRKDVLLAVDRGSAEHPQDVDILTDEFTAVCPWTGLPDTGSVKINYRPHTKILELKALKFYFLSYRDVGIIQEDAADRILADLVAILDPHWMTVELDYTIRGGIKTVVTARYGEPPWVRLGE